METNLQIIDVTKIDNEISNLESQLKISEANNDSIRAGIETFELRQLYRIKTELITTKLTDLLVSAMQYGHDENTSGKYLSQIDTQTFFDKYLNSKTK